MRDGAVSKSTILALSVLQTSVGLKHHAETRQNTSIGVRLFCFSLYYILRNVLLYLVYDLRNKYNSLLSIHNVVYLGVVHA